MTKMQRQDTTVRNLFY